MTDYFHHPHQVGIFFIPAKHLQLPVSGDEQKWRGVISNMKQGGQIINYSLCTRYASLFANGKMGNGMATEWYQSCNAISINTKMRQIAFI